MGGGDGLLDLLRGLDGGPDCRGEACCAAAAEVLLRARHIAQEIVVNRLGAGIGIGVYLAAEVQIIAVAENVAALRRRVAGVIVVVRRRNVVAAEIAAEYLGQRAVECRVADRIAVNKRGVLIYAQRGAGLRFIIISEAFFKAGNTEEAADAGIAAAVGGMAGRFARGKAVGVFCAAARADEAACAASVTAVTGAVIAGITVVRDDVAAGIAVVEVGQHRAAQQPAHTIGVAVV